MVARKAASRWYDGHPDIETVRCKVDRILADMEEFGEKIASETDQAAENSPPIS